MADQGVSIIIDCYRHEAFVGAAIESALAQDHPRLQVIVVDDGSPDGSVAAIRRFGDAIEFVAQANQGQVACCRTGFALARHDIVIFLDSDDLLEPDAARRVAALWSSRTAKVQWAMHVIDDAGRRLGNVFPKYPARLRPEQVVRCLRRTGSYPDSPTSGNAYSRRLLEAALPMLPRRNGLDGELNGIAPLFGDVLTIAEPLGSYRIHGDNSFSQNRLDMSKFAGYRAHSEARFAFVRDFWRARGETIAADAIRGDLKYLEYEWVERRFVPKAATPARSPGRLLAEAVRAAWLAPESPASRVFRLLWMMAVALLPRASARALVEQRYVPQRRWRWLRWLAR